MKQRQEKLYQRIVAAIGESIGAGRYTIGMRLPGERELAEEFGVSRPTIREAMIALEIHGLVEARHGSGLYVTAPSGQLPSPRELDIGAFELIEARILFEGEGAALAASVIDDEALAELDGLLEQMAGCDPATPQAMEIDRHFHQRIAEATGNTVIGTVVETLWSLRDRAPLSAHIFAEARREGVHPRVDEHRSIVEALRARDADAARHAMREHLKRVVDDLLNATEVEALRQTQSRIDEQRDAVRRRLHP
ncbi:GntR family transcriptional regulator [Sphingomonas sp. Leaf231]|nr:GntR family transcriptional regulator [Sphingomonas sp. Leaf231]